MPEQARPRPAITRADLLHAALGLLGPNRSVSTLTLREVARAAGIAPNSFYRHFRDVDELAVALIEEAGRALRQIIGEARTRAESEESVVSSSVEVFMRQLQADPPWLLVLLREGAVGSEAFRAAVDQQLRFFESELQEDLVRIAERRGQPIVHPEVLARAITRLVFTMGASAADRPVAEHAEIAAQIKLMLRMLITGDQVMARLEGGR